MGLLDWAKSLIMGNINGTPTVKTTVGGLPVYPDSNVTTFVDDGYAGNASIFSIIRTAAGKFGSVPVYLYQVEDKASEKRYKNATKGVLNSKALYYTKKLKTKAYKEDEIVNDLSKLLSHPNEYEGQDAFFEKVYAFKLVTGEAFIWLNRGDTTGPDGKELPDEIVVKMPVLEMYVLPTQYVQIVIDPDNMFGVSGYFFQPNSERIPISKVNIIHWKSTSLQFDKFLGTHLRGMSPLKPGLKTLTQDTASNDAAVAMYQNGGAKGVLFEKSIAKLGTDQLAKLDRVIDRRINNRDMKGAVVRMQGDWGYANLGLSSIDMELLEAQELSMKKLCRLIGVPYELFESGTTFANKETAWKFFICNTILPAWCSFRDELNRQLTPSFKDAVNMTIDVDYSDMPELQEDMSTQVTALKDAWWLTPNERREIMLEETDETVPEMDMYLIPQGLVPIGDVGMNQMDNILANGGGNLPDVPNNA